MREFPERLAVTEPTKGKRRAKITTADGRLCAETVTTMMAYMIVNRVSTHHRLVVALEKTLNSLVKTVNEATHNHFQYAEDKMMVAPDLSVADVRRLLAELDTMY